MKYLINKLKLLVLPLVSEQHNLKDDSTYLLNVCDNYIIRHRMKISTNVIESINLLSTYLEILSKDVSNNYKK